MKFGLVSVSFRSLSCEEIIRITKKSGLDGIEWGGDVHVPPDNPDNAKRIASLMKEAGLLTSAYGSYYRAGTYGENYIEEFRKVLDTAVILGAPVIRIWAGNKGSKKISTEKRKEIVSECVEIAKAAGKENITVSFECHINTLTDNFVSALQLMKETDRENLRMYWQPSEYRSRRYNLEALQNIIPYLTNVHVFNWPLPAVKLPLKFASKEWEKYFTLISSDGKEHWCSLEFMPDGKAKSLPKEAQTMKEIYSNI